MAATVQMNTRINSTLKASGDAVLRRNGYTPSSAIQALWTYVTENNSLPSFMPRVEDHDAKAQLMAEIEDGAGLAIKMQEQLLGIPEVYGSEVDELSYERLKELAWEDRGAFND